MNIRNIPGGEGRPARKADNLAAICEPIVYKNVGALTSHSPMGLHGPLQGYLYLYAGCEVLTAVDMKSSIFWDITPYSLLKNNHVSEEYAASFFMVED
jgi:hypothetical protein